VGIAPSFQAAAELRDKLYRVADILSISPNASGRVYIGVKPACPVL
jgi:hypothetical protein